MPHGLVACPACFGRRREPIRLPCWMSRSLLPRCRWADERTALREEQEWVAGYASDRFLRHWRNWSCKELFQPWRAAI